MHQLHSTHYTKGIKPGNTRKRNPAVPANIVGILLVQNLQVRRLMPALDNQPRSKNKPTTKVLLRLREQETAERFAAEVETPTTLPWLSDSNENPKSPLKNWPDVKT
ncbi:hypothetical protein DAPPUDRAFT_237954 [Daphnia pulex]|uniref:Uncharacterized protein n=1 Tax=Daphnia pulex TaxID=6669 RepID=E9G4V0_DAPPU|nr:hypothetical protein DAPPUDRAFT_237954 [Daphnia pulex]|eukprot:EFX85362.1 hypothetical protein DAPPUDRAFT_237954 [Daphnia pulex]